MSKLVEDLENVGAQLRAENALLKSQLLCFVNMKNDAEQLMFYTGLSVDMLISLWSFLKPSPGNALSAKSTAAKADGRLNYPGAGRKHASMEDQLLVTYANPSGTN